MGNKLVLGISGLHCMLLLLMLVFVLYEKYLTI